LGNLGVDWRIILKLIKGNVYLHGLDSSALGEETCGGLP
jgi:hypothetical protein